MNDLLKTNKPSAGGSVACLGMTFSSDDARREHFLELLAEKLKDPDFRNQEGFPQGTDEAILAMSDPPYYTACPNPWLADFVKHYGKPYIATEGGAAEPLVADVSEGKNDPIYNAHSYHTKVPHKAIMRYILHYTQPGGCVLDSFCGTGMTGVAAQLCGDRRVVESLGYKVDKEGIIFEPATVDGRQTWKPVSRLGSRAAILNELSPAASFITANYNKPVDADQFRTEAQNIVDQINKEIGWMYETRHGTGSAKGKINFTLWSDVFVCPECAGEIVFWEAAADTEAAKVRDEFSCPTCSVRLKKRGLAGC